MAQALILRFTLIHDNDGNALYESNSFQINGYSGLHIDFTGAGNSVTLLRSITGINFVSSFHDYCGETFDRIILEPGIGQAYKVRVNKLPSFALVHGEVEDMGDPNPEDSNDLMNAFCGSEGEFFMGKEGHYFICKHPT